MDRKAITELVEDYWRTIIPAMQNGGPAAQMEASNRFEERLARTAALLSPVESLAFNQQVESERERLMAEYTANPIALKKRLGIAMGVDAQARSTTLYRRNELGNLAVRTAVRATVWESIWTLFRTFR